MKKKKLKKRINELYDAIDECQNERDRLSSYFKASEEDLKRATKRAESLDKLLEDGSPEIKRLRAYTEELREELGKTLKIRNDYVTLIDTHQALLDTIEYERREEWVDKRMRTQKWKRNFPNVNRPEIEE